MATEGKTAILAGVVGCILGMSLSVVWMLYARMILTGYHIDAGNLVQYKVAAQNPVACWLAYGPMPFLAVAGFIAGHSLAAGSEEGLKQGTGYVRDMLAAFLVSLFVTVVMLLMHISIATGFTLIIGNTIVLLVTMGLVLGKVLPAYQRTLKASKTTASEIRKGLAAAILAALLTVVFTVGWIYVVYNDVYLFLASSYTQEAITDIIIHNLAIDWLLSGVTVVWIMISLFISLTVVKWRKPGGSFTVKASKVAATYVVAGFFLWLFFSLILQLAQVKIAPVISTGAGNIFLGMLLIFAGNGLIREYLSRAKSVGGTKTGQ